jgi:hypothetical protein
MNYKFTSNVMKNLIKAVIIAIVGIIVGYMLMLIVYMLPTEPMKDNISQSANIFDTEREYHRVIPGYISTQLDNYTDAWMVGNAIFDNKDQPLLKRALSCTRAEYGEGPLDALVRYVSGDDNYYSERYARYWHGYLVVLKPLFLIFNYADLRVINIILEIMLVLAVFVNLRRKGFLGESYAYIISILFIMPVVIPLSIQFSVIFYIANIAALLMLKCYGKLKESNKLIIYFQLIGMVTSFFDFLTYPIATLGMATVCMLLMGGVSENVKSSLSRVKDVIICSISWGFGYVSMWFGKWVLSTVVLGDNIIADAFNQITKRSAHVTEGEEIGIIDTWLRNTEFYFEKPYMIIILISVVAGIVLIAKNIRKFKEIMSIAVPYIITAFMPFAWYAVAMQHSYEHHWFTFRGTMVSVFALLCAVIGVYKQMKTNR